MSYYESGKQNAMSNAGESASDDDLRQSLETPAACTDVQYHSHQAAWHEQACDLYRGRQKIFGIKFGLLRHLRLAGITIIYTVAPAPPPPPPPAGASAASVLALPLSALIGGPFALNAGAPVAAGFQAPAYLQGFKFSQLPAYSVLPAVSSLPTSIDCLAA